MLSKIIMRIFFTAILLSGFTLAQNYNDAIRLGFPGLGPDARALGMGNSFVAISDNASGSYFNPAGLGLIKNSVFAAGFDFSNFNNDVSFLGNESSSKTNGTKFNQASIVLPFPTKQGSMVIGIGYNQSKDLSSIVAFNGFNSGNTSWINYFSNQNSDIPYDLKLSYPLYDQNNKYIKDTTHIYGGLNQSGTILNTGSINDWNFSGAIEVAKNTFIGGNFTIHTGSFESNNDYYEDDFENNYTSETVPDNPLTRDFQTFSLNRLLRWDIGGWSGKLGMMYQWESFMRIGFTVQFPKIYTIEETFDVNGSSEFATQDYFLDTYFYSDKVKYDIQTPYEFTAGAAFNLAFLIVTGQATIIDYTQMEFKNPEGIDPTFFSDQNSFIKQTMRVAYNGNIGAELTLPLLPIKLRAGAIYQQSPFEDDDPAFDRKYLTAGAGFNFDGAFSIDAAYTYGWWKDIGDNYDSEVSRTYQDIKQQTIMLTTTFRF